jgi:seryl-tRNA synthetase
MNTNTNKIFEKLSKVKEAKEKQELGAIEDAIAKVTSDLESKEKELQDMYDAFEQEVIDAINVIVNEADYMMSATASSESQFKDKLAEFDDLLSELTTAGIDYDQSVVYNLQSNFSKLGESARKITELDGSKF